VLRHDAQVIEDEQADPDEDDEERRVGPESPRHQQC